MSTVNHDLLDELEADEQERLTKELEGASEKEKRRFKFLDREPIFGRTKGGVDPETGWRYEFWDVGMVRNAKPENRHQEKVFIDPVPHIVKPQHVPLRGWYKSKYEPPRVRPKPCFTDALLTQPYGGTCQVGCPFCYLNGGTRGYRGAGVTVVDPTYPEQITKQLKRM